ncbi:MAG TPA: cytochrome c oxidase assembly protein [Methylomirabilota bacterium]
MDGTWRPELALPLALAVLVYALGWARLTLRLPARLRPASIGRLALALTGLVVIATALLGLHAAAHERFLAHMVQHLLLMMIGLPLVLLADPLPSILWSLPGGARARLRGVLGRRSCGRRVWSALTRMPVAWTLHAAVLWGWHLPVVYDAALARDRLHDLEHLTFALAAIVFWWPVIGPAPRAAAPPTAVARVVYLVLAAFSSGALGVLLATSPVPLYAYPGTAGGPSPLEDQAWGGIVMWAVGGAIDMAAVLVVVGRVIAGERRGRRVVGVPRPRESRLS